eukprot:350172-Chlamydomonas_euryale.AAC.2
MDEIPLDFRNAGRKAVISGRGNVDAEARGNASADQMSSGCFVLDADPAPGGRCSAIRYIYSSGSCLHQASGHVSHTTLDATLRSDAVTGAPAAAADVRAAHNQPIPCKLCAASHSTREGRFP